MSKRTKFLAFSVINIIMSSVMSFTASYIHGDINYKTFLLIPLGYIIGMILSYMIPFGKIGEWTLIKTKAKNVILKNIMKNLIPAIINTVVIGLIMTFINAPVKELGFYGFIMAYLNDLWILFIIGTVAACLANPLAVKIMETADKKEEK